ncbi:tetratricopeptide repeat protein [Aggregicoccus sp. 17bor-14]|uniref:tetratricopeptide repeat protein n=1 Tax=Myxococcaceae TaxID=31 RepID=UPI00129CBC1B|nr:MULTISPECIES: tetratricopeptide repeat protein [Myxococcaceae]MBF5044135.1 tetratricopeptide repeat protein [Simulacricoccus sp. 17bor-14]MRI89885.1 tetratricopeptide repeat protein [Aggregicoccus sp. 17bor-14]
MVALLLACMLLASVPPANPSAAPSARLDAALAREASGDDAGALADLEALALAQPTWALPRLEAARLRLKLGQDTPRLGADLDVAEALAPTNPRVHYLRGLLWEERGQARAAVQAYERALSYRAAYDEPRLRLGALYAAQGDWLHAELHYRTLAHAHPQAVPVRVELARVLEAQGRVSDAERELEALRAAQPTQPLVLRRLAELYERTGRPQLAAPLRAQLERPAGPPKRALQPSRR